MLHYVHVQTWLWLRQQSCADEIQTIFIIILFPGIKAVDVHVSNIVLGTNGYTCILKT